MPETQIKCFCPKQLQQWTGGYWTRLPDKPIVNFCFDTRQLKENECFLALCSKHNDGHAYVAVAETCGAVAALVDHPIKTCGLPQLVVSNTLKAFQQIAKNYRHLLKTTIIGLTGSCGKTTAKELLALLLGPKTFKTPGNYNNHLGLPFSITQIDNKKHLFAVLEVGISKPGEMDVLSNMLCPDFGIVLNINPVHLENFKTLEAIACEKLKILQTVKNGAFCPYEWCSYVQHANTFCFSFKRENALNVIFLDLKMTQEGWSITVDNTTFHVPFRIGEKSAQTFAQMLGFALKLGIPANDLQKRLLLWQPYVQRGVWIERDEYKVFMDCYNANPIAFIDSLEHFYRELDVLEDSNASIVYCIGSMLELGKESYGFHKALAQYFRMRANDHFILIGAYKEALLEGLLNAGAQNSQLYYADTFSEIQDLLQHLPFKFIYLKGSHYYHLENLIAE